MVPEWPIDTRPEPAGSPLRLGAAQRRDLFRMATAGIVTAFALVGSALFISPEGDSRGAAGVAAAAEPAHPEPPDDDVTIRTDDVVPTVIVEQPPPVRRAPARPIARPPQLVTKSANVTTTPPREEPRTFGRRLARLITGDGRHEVRPFPTVPDGH